MEDGASYRAEKVKLRGHLISALLFIYLLLVMPMPWEYRQNQCELIAKDYQREYWGDLIFIQPLKQNGAYDLGEYNGHYINKAYEPQKRIYYIDYQTQTYFNDTEEIRQWYKETTGRDSEIYNLNQEHPPFPIIWHY